MAPRRKSAPTSQSDSVSAVRWLQALQAGAPAGVVLAATNAKALEVVPLEALRSQAVDVPDDPSSLGEQPSGDAG